MASNADLQAAVNALGDVITNKFSELSTVITDETTKITAALSASGVDQTIIDQITALGTTLSSNVDTAEAGIKAELP